MNRKTWIILFVFINVSLYSVCGLAQNPVNWTQAQLIEPSVLADKMMMNKDVPVIISVSPGAVIQHSFNAGMVSTTEGKNIFMSKLDSLPKDAEIIIYCGCCPFEHCPNVRPAMAALKEKGFTNYYLLNLPNNVKTDWISKGYPTNQ